jgi:predicted ATPase/class 3 adenylate cyclase
MAELPRGTVTLLFTDIEGSTRLLQELGDDLYVRALEDHRRLLREAFTARDGVEVEMQGDAFHFAFPDALGAVLGAAEAQRALIEHPWESSPIRVRIGIHTGIPLVSGHLYAGLDVHRASRVMSAGHGGQILLSETTHALVESNLPPGLSARDLGEHRLKDLSAPQRLYQLGDGEFPPLASLYRTNLPVPATPFLGRERELREVSALLAQDGVRLLTLTGVGGTGKTRLAAQAAAEVSELFPDGVFWIGLASLRDPELVTATIAQVLGTNEDLASHIGAKRLLLLLDNFEHVIEASIELAALLSACPEVSLLVTSREALHISAEREYAVLPLREADAILLFRERAQAIGIAVTHDSEVPEICRRLDHLPLAIELAAARVKVLTPPALLERLEPRLPLLTGGARDTPERQRTLRATIDWSYALLTPEEQRLFARLAVFAGGCTMEAAEEICDAELETLQSLVDKSLLRRTDERFWMLETIREFAAERLEEADDGDAVPRKHASWFAELAHRAASSSRTERTDVWLPRLDDEHDNLRATLEWALAAGEDALGSTLAVDLSDFWVTHGHLSEGRRWLELWLDRGTLTPERRIQVLHEASSIAVRQGDDERAASLGSAFLEATTEAGDDRGVVQALAKLAWTAVRQGDFERAAELQEEAITRARHAGDRRALLVALTSLGLFELRRGRVDAARSAFVESLELAREAAEKSGARATAVFNLGLVEVVAGSHRAAARWLAEALALYGDLGDLEGIGYCLSATASIAVAVGDHASGARLLGASGALLEGVDALLEPVEESLRGQAEGAARAALSTTDFARLFAEGAGLEAKAAERLGGRELSRLGSRG